MASTARARSIGPVSVLQVRPDFYMLTVDGINLGLQSGPEGAVLVDSGDAHSGPSVVAALRELSATPLRFVFDTSADVELVGGNDVVAAAGDSLTDLLDFNRVPGVASQAQAPRASIVARQEVLTDLVAAGITDGAALPTETFARPQYHAYLNNQGIASIWMPAAHSDADSVVLFRGSDVVVTGAVFDDAHFPVIDLKNGGSIDGELAAINRIMNALVFAPVPAATNTGGTLVIPERGPVCDQSELLHYRDMLDAVRARVLDLIQHGATYAQVVASDPLLGYETRYGAPTGGWTSSDFLRAVYTSLVQQRRRRQFPSGR